MKRVVFDKKHLSTSQRLLIEKVLNDILSFAAIARRIQKHPSTIAKEVYVSFARTSRSLFSMLKHRNSTGYLMDFFCYCYIFPCI